MKSLMSDGEEYRRGHALDSITQYHSQYNKHEDLLKFKSTVSKKDLFNFNKNANLRMNEIHAKLKSPIGHLQLMERSQIVQNRVSSHRINQ